MSQFGFRLLHRNAAVVALAVVLGGAIVFTGCGGAISNSHNQQNNDPLGLGVSKGQFSQGVAQTLQIRLGSEPNDRIVSLSLTIDSLRMKNSSDVLVDLITDPVTVEFTREATVSDPISIRSIYDDSYSTLVFPAMTGQVVYYDANGQLTSQDINVPAKTVDYNFVLSPTDPLVLSMSLDLAQSFTITDTAGLRQLTHPKSQTNSLESSTFTVNSPVITAGTAVPVPTPVGQPETGSISFIVGRVTSVDTSGQKLTVRPTSGDGYQLSYDGETVFVNCDPTMLTNAIVEAEATTQSNGSILASEVEFIDNVTSGSELYGIVSGHAPDGISYNLITEGGVGINVTTTLIGKNITLDWLSASYAINGGNVPTGYDDLVFDEDHLFPGQFLEAEWDTLIVPDPDSANAGYMQPRMFELEEQTLTGVVSGYAWDPVTQAYTFTLAVANNSALKNMNPGLTELKVRRTTNTYLRSNPTFNDGDTVKVRGLLFVNPVCLGGNYYCSNATYRPSPTNLVRFVLVADRISK